MRSFRGRRREDGAWRSGTSADKGRGFSAGGRGAEGRLGRVERRALGSCVRIPSRQMGRRLWAHRQRTRRGKDGGDRPRADGGKLACSALKFCFEIRKRGCATK